MAAMSILSRLLLAVPFLLSACLATGAGSGPDLDGRTFLSTDVTDAGTSHPLAANTRLRISFSHRQIGLSAGCNSMGGAYVVRNGLLTVTDLTTTDMGCDPDLMDQDTWLADLITSGPTIRLDGNDLRIKGGETVIHLVDREVADPDRPLVGPTWSVVSVISGDAVSSVPDGVLATLSFTDDGQVLIDTGCNGAGGRYATGDGTVTFSDIVSELKLCLDDRNAMEVSVMGVLNAGEVTYSIEADMLTLSAGEHGLQLRAS